MAKKSSVIKERKRERLVNLKWEKRQHLKRIISDITKSDEERMEAVNKLNKLPRNSSPIRLRNRCSITGRSRGYLRKFKISRLCFREMASDGLIPGVTKASW
jgi:small subunit ribosomal protein S14